MLLERLFQAVKTADLNELNAISNQMLNLTNMDKMYFLNARDPNGNTILALAVNNGILDRVFSLFDMNAYPLQAGFRASTSHSFGTTNYNNAPLPAFSLTEDDEDVTPDVMYDGKAHDANVYKVYLENEKRKLAEEKKKEIERMQAEQIEKLENEHREAERLEKQEKEWREAEQKEAEEMAEFMQAEQEAHTMQNEDDGMEDISDDLIKIEKTIASEMMESEEREAELWQKEAEEVYKLMQDEEFDVLAGVGMINTPNRTCKNENQNENENGMLDVKQLSDSIDENESQKNRSQGNNFVGLSYRATSESNQSSNGSSRKSMETCSSDSSVTSQVERMQSEKGFLFQPMLPTDFNPNSVYSSSSSIFFDASANQSFVKASVSRNKVLRERNQDVVNGNTLTVGQQQHLNNSMNKLYLNQDTSHKKMRIEKNRFLMLPAFNNYQLNNNQKQFPHKKRKSGKENNPNISNSL